VCVVDPVKIWYASDDDVSVSVPPDVGVEVNDSTREPFLKYAEDIT
jgi:hypothetical protein